MPQVKRIRKRRAVAPRGAKTKRVATGADVPRGIRMAVYGRGKTGKTRFACSFPKPLLLIGTEDGTRSVCTSKQQQGNLQRLMLRDKPLGIDLLPLESADAISEAVSLCKGGEYTSVVLDTGGGLQDLVLMSILELDDVPVEKSWGMAQRSDWQTCGMQTKEHLRVLLRLGEGESPMNVVIIAHERNFNDDSNDAGGILFPTVGAALTPSVAGWLSGACDYYCQTFIREKTEKQTTKIGGKEVSIDRKVGKAEYCLRVGAHPVYMTGFRVPPGIELPEAVENPSFDKLVSMGLLY